MKEDNLEIQDLKKEINDLKQEVQELSKFLKDFTENLKPKADSNETCDMIDETYLRSEEDDDIENSYYYLSLLKKELKTLEKKQNFKIREISDFIKNIKLGDFNKQKFNKFIRKKIIPQAEEKEKNQFLYNKKHIPYAIIFQCFKSLDIAEFSKLWTIMRISDEESIDIYTTIESVQIDRIQGSFYMKDINQIAIGTYILYQIANEKIKKLMPEIIEKEIKDLHKLEKIKDIEGGYLTYSPEMITGLLSNEILIDFSVVFKNTVFKGIMKID